MKYYTIVLFACLTYIPSLLHAQELASLATDLEILTYGAQGLLGLYAIMNRPELTSEQAHARDKIVRNFFSLFWKVYCEEMKNSIKLDRRRLLAEGSSDYKTYTESILDLQNWLKENKNKKITLQDLDIIFEKNILLSLDYNNERFFLYMILSDTKDVTTYVEFCSKLADISLHDIQHFYVTEVVLKKDSAKDSLAMLLEEVFPTQDTYRNKLAFTDFYDAFFGQNFIKEIHTIEHLR